MDLYETIQPMRDKYTQDIESTAIEDQTRGIPFGISRFNWLVIQCPVCTAKIGIAPDISEGLPGPIGIECERCAAIVTLRLVYGAPQIEQVDLISATGKSTTCANCGKSFSRNDPGVVPNVLEKEGLRVYACSNLCGYVVAHWPAEKWAAYVQRRSPMPQAEQSDAEPLTTEAGDRILKFVKVCQALATKSNKELADLLVEHAWAHLPVTSPLSQLINEVIERLDPDQTEQRSKTQEG